MGLDMYAYKTKFDNIKDPEQQVKILKAPYKKDTNEYVEEISEREQIGDWRKHNRLHGYMEQVWHNKDCPGIPLDEDGEPIMEQGFGSSFNLIPLLLDKTDIIQLQQAITRKGLPETEGFFFGGDSYSDDEWGQQQKEENLEFISNALKAIKNGYIVNYDSWW